MTVVEPPYLLDFAGVTFEPIDFSTDTQREIGLKIERQFGTNAHFAYLVQHELEKYGIYYHDLRPSNLNLVLCHSINLGL